MHTTGIILAAGSRILIVSLSIVALAGIALFGSNAYTFVSRQLPREETPLRLTSAPVSEEKLVNQVLSDDQMNTVSASATSTTEVASLKLAQTQSKNTPKPAMMVVASSSLVSRGIIDPSWSNNSWGLSLQRKDGSLIAEYNDEWSALSLYSPGFDLRNIHSIELVFISTSTKSSFAEIDHLYLAFYQGGLRLGSVHLAPYIKSMNGWDVARIPLDDMELKSNVLTSVILESDAPTRLSIDTIQFSSDFAESKKISVVTEKPETAIIEKTEKLVPLSPVIEPTIYLAGLKNSWQVQSRRATVDVHNTERSITGASIKVSFDSFTSALSFVNPNGFDSKGYSALELYVFGGVTDHEWQQLFVTLYDINGKKLGTQDISKYSSTGRISMQVWSKYDVPLSEFNAENALIGTIDIENASVTKVGDSMWVDQVMFFRY